MDKNNESKPTGMLSPPEDKSFTNRLILLIFHLHIESDAEWDVATTYIETSKEADRAKAKGNTIIIPEYYELKPDIDLQCILAHEKGHIALRHERKNKANGIIYIILLYCIAALFPVDSALYWVLFCIIIIGCVWLGNELNKYFNHSHEYQADAYACKYVNPDDYIKWLSKNNFGATKSHPSAKNRIGRISISKGLSPEQKEKMIKKFKKPILPPLRKITDYKNHKPKDK